MVIEEGPGLPATATSVETFLRPLIFLVAAAALVQSSDSEAEVSVEELGDAAAWSGFNPRRMARNRCFWPV